MVNAQGGIVTIHHDLDNADRRDLASLTSKGLEWLASEHKVDRVGMTFGKRAFDICFALVLLIPLSFVIALVAVILLATQGRPLFYVAPRMRAPGEQFDLLKFRTMLREDDDSGATGAHKHWRITPIGRFLRRTRIDELPQLFNILRGDMSFVGPRPPLREYVERFPALYGQVLKNRPGVTGLATMIYHAHEDRIMGNCQTAEATEAAYYRRCLPTKLRLDLIYQRRCSLRVDLWIIWHTLMTVVIPNWQGRCRRRIPSDQQPMTIQDEQRRAHVPAE
ncbi:lipopolysaccharide/colanic/teichoic acid biosynthesis glycosyltransferase [Paracoccus lutimaris]|uniref:Lipopolysaccharide/colanic/teichoic acid biosynthesis glycosyltransferase n=1 Tax=Paracoccus lutimaris TaxID=1490030 RepID=A0A368Z7X3_9RHOB|nr:lipopolysaccharide/colanic/teichoic acid biosynthesis glycosyltransferase [Paracoccus lutimaris]